MIKDWTLSNIKIISTQKIGKIPEEQIREQISKFSQFPLPSKKKKKIIDFRFQKLQVKTFLLLWSIQILCQFFNQVVWCFCCCFVFYKFMIHFGYQPLIRYRYMIPYYFFSDLVDCLFILLIFFYAETFQFDLVPLVCFYYCLCFRCVLSHFIRIQLFLTL